MFQPVTTYRIQFHKDFSFDHLEKTLDYFKKLGISTIYASPVLAAVPGSVHGYDCINAHIINPEIGTEDQWRAINEKLRSNEISWLQDIVPNHMAFDHRNDWLMEVLALGKRSSFAGMFDIFWDSRVYEGRLMVPFLGTSPDEAIEEGALQLTIQQDKLVFQYFDSYFPVNPSTYYQVLSKRSATKTGKKLMQTLDELLSEISNELVSKKWAEVHDLMREYLKEEKNFVSIHNAISKINKNKARLKELIQHQEYRFCHWKETDDQINYRRFFTVNGLICLNIQNDEVFGFYHQYIKKLHAEKLFQGIRVDHIDGLYDPEKYLQQLRSLAGPESYIVVEKILQNREELSASWPVEGNTGYDFLAQVNNLLTNRKNEALFTQFYQLLTGDRMPVEHQVYEKKWYILSNHMKGEWETLYLLFLEVVEKKKLSKVHPDDLREAIGEFLVQCPYYRFYPLKVPVQGEEKEELHHIFQRIYKSGNSSTEAIQLLEEVILDANNNEEEIQKKILHFYRRCMQFSSPLMAKGVEDTLMYTYARFIAHNEVGDDPGAFGMNVMDFHERMKKKLECWPLSINATATHDTKRGEDARARLNVISDLADDWFEIITTWQELNSNNKQENIPDTIDEYFIYQSLVGAYPFNESDQVCFEDRFLTYLEKAFREAKRYSNWTTPDESYELGTRKFAKVLLDKQRPFWESFKRFLTKIEDHGIVNSLVQLVLKFTCPGVPDTYQGTELWDFSFVDPDNRRAVDYAFRYKLLEDIGSMNCSQLWAERKNGAIKIWLTQKLMQLRKSRELLFSEGEYLPLEVEGSYRDHVIAYSRRRLNQTYIIVLPLHTALLSAEQKQDVLSLDWKDTYINLPLHSTGEVASLFSNEKTRFEKKIPVNNLFKEMPIAILQAAQEENERAAGVLMHITSLPSAFGIGDLGPEAYAFADFLSSCNQKYWQLLPVNTTEGGQAHSPYSATSSKAGNRLLISPELLANEGWVEKTVIEEHRLPATDQVDFDRASEIRFYILEKAFERFQALTEEQKTDFFSFCSKEAEWLEDYALYACLKNKFEGKPWYQWPDDYKLRLETILLSLKSEEAEQLEKIKFEQYLFFHQWQLLKNYCTEHDIRIIGDMPFYISYDSVDVWSQPELFALDEEGNPKGMAGVPPDAFSDDGQLWGMPVYNWERLKVTGYDWWIKRLRKNIELFDLVRLDHFRAFVAYWEVPANETTARNGQWVKGPGHKFFECLIQEFEHLPFIAEDLGDIDEEVLRLRDYYHLPGMKILQFAFGPDMPSSAYIPHHYPKNAIAYTGTHDNNTTRGWYEREVSEEMRLRLEAYVGRPVSVAEIHLELARLAYASVANLVILPIQDILGLDESARMNIPSSAENNWSWRLQPELPLIAHEEKLRKWTLLYNRE